MVKKMHGSKPFPTDELPLHEVGRRGSAVAVASRALVRMSMDAADGDYLGSEASLLAKLGVSRPTLRQAAKIVESDQLLEVRPGLNGGFYARRPEARHVVQAPAFYLRINGATLHEAGVATDVIMSSVAAAAALSDDQMLRDELKNITEELEATDDETYTTRYMIDLEQRLLKLIARMGRNPFFELFVQITHEFGLLERDLRFYERAPERKLAWRRLQENYCHAVLDGDPEQAALLVHRRNALVNSWIREDSNAPGATAALENL
jgi:DNA-binding FadR family transcriptional regulator